MELWVIHTILESICTDLYMLFHSPYAGSWIHRKEDEWDGGGDFAASKPQRWAHSRVGSAATRGGGNKTGALISGRVGRCFDPTMMDFDLIDLLELQFRCCGVRSYKDWITTNYQVLDSCCKQETKNCADRTALSRGGCERPGDVDNCPVYIKVSASRNSTRNTPPLKQHRHG